MAAEPIGLVLERLADRARGDDALGETLAFLAEDDSTSTRSPVPLTRSWRPRGG